MALVAVLAKCQPEQGPPENLKGEVLAVEVVVSKFGHVSLRVRADTPDGVRVVALPAEAVCWPGDRIELRKRGAVYQAGAGDCSPGRRRRATPHPSGSA
ncbi:hypothetical protein ACO2Q0_16490 [Phenylobacterium sp. VNQ135]|uniref:hypothetical protein n=1 Tax=Phenylobacterium sp. VNQ135 TaxID=3400922 RepID=UPI003C0D64F0